MTAIPRPADCPLHSPRGWRLYGSKPGPLLRVGGGPPARCGPAPDSPRLSITAGRRTVLTAPTFQARWAGTQAVITFPPEADIANAGQAAEELNVILAQRPAVLVVDLSTTTFCDSSIIAALIHASIRADALGVALRIAGARDSITRVMHVTGADQVLDLYATLAAALDDTTGQD